MLRICAAGALVLAMTALPAGAASLLHFSLGGTHTAEFDVAEFPTVSSSDPGISFTLPGVTGVFDGSAGVQTIVFRSTSASGGLAAASAFDVVGPQVYLGGEVHPQFLTGDYHFTDAATGAGAGLAVFPSTASPAPEPGSWLLMMAGLAMAGLGLRRRALRREGGPPLHGLASTTCVLP